MVACGGKGVSTEEVVDTTAVEVVDTPQETPEERPAAVQ